MSNRDIRAVVIEPEVHFGQGWKLIHAIHKAFPEQLIPVIVCSTRDADGTDLAEEIAKHLTKPVLPKTLREKTLEVISGENERRESS